MSDKQVLNWQVVTVLITLLLQFAGGVWVASRVTFQVEMLASQVAVVTQNQSKLKNEFHAERSRTSPIAMNLSYIERDIKEIKLDLAEIMKDFKGKK